MDSRNEILAETRKWIQWVCINGDCVEWGSQDVLLPHVTVSQLERFAINITSNTRSKFRNRIKELENRIKELEK